MFKAVIDDSKLFKDSISTINEIISEGVFEISNEGMKLVAMDPSSVAMIIFQLLPSAFTTFEIDQPQKIGLSMDQLKNVLRRITGSERVILSVDDSRFNIEIHGTHKRSFTLPIIDFEADDLRIPSLEFDAIIALKASVLKDGVDDVSIISDSVSLIANPNSFVMNSKSESSEVKIVLDPSETDLILNIDVKAESKSKYSVEYLNKMIKASKLAEELTLHFKNDYPLRLDYASKDKLKVSFILAPRVETE
ncbi:MAG: proliferating cell nuclear antigen (pcna) [Nanoarchaeota archaeon]|nr:proliferating cell nuclear antigen (pcna) [Nanoarchaeota archaeon]